MPNWVGFLTRICSRVAEERFLHREFSRIMNIKEECNKEAVKRWKTKHNLALNQSVKNAD